MPEQIRIVSRGSSDRTVVCSDGKELSVPADWHLLPPGDAGLTRRVKLAGPHWVVQEKMGRRTFSKGVWAPADRIERIKLELENERSTDAYSKRRESEQRRREKKQDDYVSSFEQAVIEFLDFDDMHAESARLLARAVTLHATPVGSGTVARTERIPIEQRAESAVIAWMRHRTTAYDNMSIERVKGRRREVRRQLAQHSRTILQKYREGKTIGSDCPLKRSLDRLRETELKSDAG